MRRSIFSASATILGLVLFLTLPTATDAADITVQPHSLAMQSLGGTVSVHTDIDYSEGAPWTATINGTLEAYLVKSDLCGNLVAKFNLEAVKDLAEANASPQLVINFVAIPSEGTPETGTDFILLTKQFNRN